MSWISRLLLQMFTQIWNLYFIPSLILEIYNTSSLFWKYLVRTFERTGHVWADLRYLLQSIGCFFGYLCIKKSNIIPWRIPEILDLSVGLIYLHIGLIYIMNYLIKLIIYIISTHIRSRCSISKVSQNC